MQIILQLAISTLGLLTHLTRCSVSALLFHLQNLTAMDAGIFKILLNLFICSTSLNLLLGNELFHSSHSWFARKRHYYL